MVKSCSAFNCTNRANGKLKGMSFHRYPLNEERRKQWTSAVLRLNFKPKSTDFVCSSHFEEKCFRRVNDRVYLMDSAVPTIFNFGCKEKFHKKRRVLIGADNNDGQNVDHNSTVSAEVKFPKVTMDEKLRSEITQIQIQFLKAIESHQHCYDKLKDSSNKEAVKEELGSLQEVMKECQERQNTLLQQVKKLSGGSMCKFKVYELPSTGNKANRRRRKDLSLPVKSEKKAVTPTVSLPSRSPSPENVSETSPESSDSSDSDDDFELSQSSMPVPLPRPMPQTLHNGKDTYQFSRHGLGTKLFRRARPIIKVSDAELCRDIPYIADPPPSPEPKDEREAKIKFMAVLNLIPIENVQEILSKKTERKRRSTAHPSFVYNNDWDVPQLKKKTRQYLSPVKSKATTANSEKTNKTEKTKIKDTKDEIKKEVVDETSSEVSTPKLTNEGCATCGATDPMLECQECSEIFHAKCPSIPIEDQSFLHCIRCRRNKRGSTESNEDDLEKKPDPFLDFNGQVKIREKLAAALCSRMEEKHQLEEKVLRLAESLAVQSKLKKDLIEEEKELMEKIKKFRRFVILYQKTSMKTEFSNTNVESGVKDERLMSLPEIK